MLKGFPIDFVRQVIEQTLLEEKIKNPSKYFGGSSQVKLFSFYEQLQKDDEVDRYVKIYRDLTNQQNRMGIIMNGTIIAPENPTITNIHQCLIIPMSFTCAFRVKLADRDMALDTINHLFDVLKGRKRDIAELDTGELFMVGTIANRVDGTPSIECGDYIIGFNSDNPTSANFVSRFQQYSSMYGITNNLEFGDYVYFKGINSLKVAIKEEVIEEDVSTTVYKVIEDDGTYPDVIFPPTHTSFTPYKVSISFDSIRCDEPRNLNSEEYCVISFGGSATLVSDSVFLGNDLTKLNIKRKLIKSSVDITISDSDHWLEPLEIPSGNSADTQVNQLLSNRFITNTHTDNLTISMQYTFIVDKSIDIIKQWFEYGRYGKQADGTSITYTNGITPNMIYEITEIWASWGNIDKYTFNGKIIESIDLENSESDTLTMTIPFQLQGANN